MKELWKRYRWLLPIIWTLVVLWAAAQYYASSCTGREVSRYMLAYPHFDKVCHIVAFGIGGTLVSLAIRGTWRPSWLWTAFLTVVIISDFGATDEWHQLYTPGRSGADVFDWLADTFGAALGALAAYVAFVINSGDFTARSRSARFGAAAGN